MKSKEVSLLLNVHPWLAWIPVGDKPSDLLIRDFGCHVLLGCLLLHSARTFLTSPSFSAWGHKTTRVLTGFEGDGKRELPCPKLS